MLKRYDPNLDPKFSPAELDALCLMWTGKFDNNNPQHLAAVIHLYPKLFKARMARPEADRLQPFDARRRLLGKE